MKVVTDLIYNENTHIVSIFKDYLILDDINEFMKRSYKTSESKVRLPKLCDFYEKYSQVFPNYVILPESKYMFKNIQKKQKFIDEVYQWKEEKNRRKMEGIEDEDQMFNSKFYNSMARNDMSMSMRQYEEQAKGLQHNDTLTMSKTPIEHLKIDELVDRFLDKDSQSHIQLQTSCNYEYSELGGSIIEGDRSIQIPGGRVSMGSTIPQGRPSYGQGTVK